MKNERLAIRWKKLAWLAGAAVVLTAIGVRPAAAQSYTSTASCSPNIVQYEAATQNLLIQCGGTTNYYAQTLPAGDTCVSNSRSIDQQKLFMSLAESALLSGKSLNFYYSVCAGHNFIEAIDLSK